MSVTLNHWQEKNDQFLHAAVSWLRLRLSRLAAIGSANSSLEKPASPPPSDNGWSVLWRAAAAAPAPLAVSSSEDSVTEEQLAQAAKAMREASEMDPPPALVTLSRLLGLSEYEQHVLLLCAAMEFDTRIAGLCAHLQGEPRRPYPTFALAMALFDNPAWDAMSPDGPLRYWRLLEINQPGVQPLTTSALRADERIVNFIKGLNVLDERLTLLVAPMQVKAFLLPPSQREVVEQILHHVQQWAAAGRPLVIQLTGSGSSSKQIVAREVAHQLRLSLYRLTSDHLPVSMGDLETVARLWHRETLLLPLRLYIEVDEGERHVSPETLAARIAALKRLVSRSSDLVFVETGDPLPELGEIATTFEVEKPTAVEQRALWEAELGIGGAETAALLAGQFHLEASTIQQLAQAARDEGDGTQGVPQRMWATCCLHTRPNLDMLAKRIEVKATWEDIVLPADSIRLLRQITDQVRARTRVYDEWGYRDTMNRGFGISVLFAGESGTGKTMAAEVLANELGLDLFCVDLSAVVSKYIGETEKNLRRCFDACEESGAILCLNEADAIFGKRSEVKDSHDRYANIEINYLLQRMEAYRGLAILTTNMKSALDTAFLRRLRFILSFPFPGVAERKQMWHKAFPPGVPVERLDGDRLARFTLTGGNLHNVAVNAAFLAAHAGTPVTMPLVLNAIRNEFRKLERPINEAEFRWLEPAVGVA
jgi:hypothetical protein